MPKRILVLSAAVGAGHLRAAQAVESALLELDPAAEVRNLDVLRLTNAAFRKIYAEAYLDLVNLAPHVLGFFYDMLDRPRAPASKRDRLRRVLEKLNLTKLTHVLEERPWDVIVNTHFLPAQIIAGLRRRRKLATPQITATTDFETHRLWVNEPCDHYTTATEEGAGYLASFGVERNKITATGVPIHPVFSRARDRGESLHKHGLKGDRPIVLQLSGGFGVGPIEKLYRGILQIERPIEVVVVAGKNEKVRQQLEQVDVPRQHRSTVIGFTTDIDELMSVADLVVSKPGGLTTSELLARGAAMAIVNPIPGQESRNSDYLLESGAAIKINNIATLPMKLGTLLSDSAKLDALKANARRIAKPQAAFEIARMALQWPDARDRGGLEVNRLAASRA
jgi:processive 1,2-diacylglycerol beta-glucosyltransferase